jgi:hypothetical protein
MIARILVRSRAEITYANFGFSRAKRIPQILASVCTPVRTVQSSNTWWNANLNLLPFFEKGKGVSPTSFLSFLSDFKE